MASSAVFQSLKPALPALECAKPDINGIEAFKLVAAQHLANTLDVPLQSAFDGLELGKKDADINVAVPRFRLKGDPKAFAQKVVDEVRLCLVVQLSWLTFGGNSGTSSNLMTTSQQLLPLVSTCSSPLRQPPWQRSRSTKSTSSPTSSPRCATSFCCVDHECSS